MVFSDEENTTQVPENSLTVSAAPASTHHNPWRSRAREDIYSLLIQLCCVVLFRLLREDLGTDQASE